MKIPFARNIDCGANSLICLSKDNSAKPPPKLEGFKLQEPKLLKQYFVSLFPSNKAKVCLYGKKKQDHFKLLQRKGKKITSTNAMKRPTLLKYFNPSYVRHSTYMDRDGNEYEPLTHQDVNSILG